MTNFTIVTDANGTLIGAVQGHEMTSTTDGITTKISFTNGHTMHKIQLEDSLVDVNDPAGFHQTLLKHLPKN